MVPRIAQRAGLCRTGDCLQARHLPHGPGKAFRVPVHGGQVQQPDAPHAPQVQPRKVRAGRLQPHVRAPGALPHNARKAALLQLRQAVVALDGDLRKARHAHAHIGRGRGEEQALAGNAALEEEAHGLRRVVRRGKEFYA